MLFTAMKGLFFLEQCLKGTMVCFMGSAAFWGVTRVGIAGQGCRGSLGRPQRALPQGTEGPHPLLVQSLFTRLQAAIPFPSLELCLVAAFLDLPPLPAPLELLQWQGKQRLWTCWVLCCGE